MLCVPEPCVKDVVSRSVRQTRVQLLVQYLTAARVQTLAAEAVKAS